MPNTPRTRQRDITLRNDRYQYRRYDKATGAIEIDNTGVRSVVGRQITTSEGHPYSQLGKSDEDLGGDFTTHRPRYGDLRGLAESPQPQFWLDESTASNRYTYFGPVYALSPGGFTNGVKTAFPPVGTSSEVDLAAAGTTAIARCKPTSSPANLSVAMAELIREGIPSMVGSQTWKNRADGVRNAGGEYLNVQFGWLPLVSEIKATASVLKNWDKMVSQYERDAGRRVRRSYEFPVERSVETIATHTSGQTKSLWHGRGEMDTIFYSALPTMRTHVRETTKRRWFSGSFTYYLPSDYTSRNKMRSVAAQATELLGLEITPEVIWNLTPWSWAVDWFSNTGDVLSVISDIASDGLVINYGYLMEHTIVKDTHTVFGARLKGAGNTSQYSTSLITESKVRRKATPFGFGLNWADFTLKQLGILGALGISRFP